MYLSFTPSCWMRLMFPLLSIISHWLLMRLSTLSLAPSTQAVLWTFQPPYLTLETGRSLQPPYDRVYLHDSRCIAVSGIGWVSPSTVSYTPVQSVAALHTNSMTTRWVVGGTVTASPAITPSRMSYSQLLNPQPWLQFRRPPTWSPTPNLGQLISSHQPAMAGLQFWMFMWSPLQDLTLYETASTPGHALYVGTKQKLCSFPPVCRSAGMDFIAVVAETLGTEDFIQVHCSTLQLSSSTVQVFHRLAITMWWGNGSLWLNH